MSLEHYFSAGLWDRPMMRISGFSWCKDQPVRVAVATLGAKILCRHHNSILSPVDTAGQVAFERLRQFFLLGQQRARSDLVAYTPITYTIDGDLLERWFLKSLINVIVGASPGYTWRLDGAVHDNPPRSFIQAAYGEVRLPKPMGLYALAHPGDTLDATDDIVFQTLITDPKALAGAVFEFRGIRFLLNLSPEEPKGTISLPSGEKWTPSTVLYHISEITHNIGHLRSHRLLFQWSSS